MTGEAAVGRRGLLEWLDAPVPGGRGIAIGLRDGAWERTPYEVLAGRVDALVRDAQCRGVGAAGPVVLAAAPSADLLTVLFAALRSGHDVCVAARPGAYGSRDEYARYLDQLLATAVPRALVCDPSQVDAYRSAVERVGVGTTVSAAGDDPAAALGAPRTDREGAVLQLTSGSSGVPDVVRMTPDLISAQCSMIGDWLAATPDDALATWLPLNHDMGLIGTLLFPVIRQLDLHLVEPSDFVRRPLRYLEVFGRGRATMTAMPPFGLDHICRRVRGDDLAGLDFSGWRSLIVGAERIPPPVVERLFMVLGPHGLRRDALCPAYGMAEAALAITGSRPGAVPHRAREGDAAARPLAADAAPDEYLGCGRPIAGVEVVVAVDGAPTRPGQVGEILVRSPSLAPGYGTEADVRDLARAAVDGEEYFATGDAGFVVDGELFVVGRLGDSLKVHGTWLFAEDLEATFALGDGVGVSPVVLLGETDGESTVVVLQDRRHPRPLDAVRRALALRGVRARLDEVLVERSAILRTSSGKPRRRALWAQYTSGRGGKDDR